MNIQILEQSTLNDGRLFFCRLSNGKDTIDFSRTEWYVNVCVRNASNKTWNRGLSGGKVFHNADQAEVIGAYKKPSIKEMINTAFNLMKS